jgi:hypothetical protein
MFTHYVFWVFKFKYIKFIGYNEGFDFYYKKKKSNNL